MWKHARKDHQWPELSRSVLRGSSTRAASCQRSCHFVGAINSAFRQLTRRRTTCRSFHHALPFLPVIHPSAHGLHSCVPTWPPPIWITAIQLKLARAVVRGEAPPPTGYHGIGRAREPVWSKAVIDNFTAPARALDLDRSEGKDLSSLV